MSLTVALDAMGGDYGPSVIVPAALEILNGHQGVRLILVGDREPVERQLRRHRATLGERLALTHASQQVEMDELPSQALRTKKDSSMRVAVNLVKEGKAHACVSAGNTGALMATARFVLKTLPGIDRPAIMATLPSMTGHTRMLDLGANVESTASQLFEFAVMGSVLASAIDHVPRPKVGLLNVAQHEIKGGERIRETARLLAASDINYIGFVEGDDIYRGTANVIVCDGFVGNVALKSSEGVAQMIGYFVRKEFTRNPMARIAGLFALPVLSSFRRRFDPREYNGASFVGLRGIVVKSHGGADAHGFARAIEQALAEIRENVPARISEHLKSVLTEKEAV